jgi:hypothetical protein
METTERIVEAYVRYVKGWATIPNVRCDGQNEIDLIAIDPVSDARYHIEVSISISQSFRKLTGAPYDARKAKERVHQAQQRRTLGFFVERKFTPATVVGKLGEMGLTAGTYERVIVTWGWDEAAASQAAAAGITLWDFRDLIREIRYAVSGSRAYFADDTLRTLNLFVHANAEAQRNSKQSLEQHRASEIPRETTDGFWIYENWVHDYATVHVADCPHCNQGRGTQGSTSNANSEWHGPFVTFAEAEAKAARTNRRDIRRCGHCRPA